jgi:hypothetical protein
MFQHKGDEALRLFITGPGVERQEIGPAMLFHRPEARAGKH